VVIIEPNVYRDGRGFFLETYHHEKYVEAGIPLTFVQDNYSRSAQGALRGLHAQIQHPQGKLIRASQGEVFDVAVDVRRGSPTFSQWVGVTLTGENFKQIYIPPGFAHGFCVLSDTADVEYKCTDLYDPNDEMVIAWNDSSINIAWPIDRPNLSKKDHSALSVDEQLERLPMYQGTWV
ncbi:MAG: dTDP-4-dehydrorhamnose 3,5-epimerase, partial [Nitrospirales bacterium]